MANNEIKTNAEIYREQRKERIAKAAKKKTHAKRDKAIGIIVKVICVLVALGFVLAFTVNALTRVFYVPQKLITAATYGDQTLTFAEYNYYYMSLYNQACNLSQQLDSQYSGYGATYFNTAADPAEQNYPGEDAPEGVKTWADYFKVMAPERGFLMKTLYNDAMNNKDFKLTDEQQKTMDDEIAELKKTYEEQAASADVSVNVYISKVCGEGLTEEKYLELVEIDFVSQYYLEWYQENAAKDATDKDLANYYEQNKDDMEIASIRYFPVVYANAEDENNTSKYTKAQAKARAEEFASKVTGEASFKELAVEYAEKDAKDMYKEDSNTIEKGLVKSSLAQLSEDFANWTFDSARKYGDINVFEVESQSAYYIAYIVSPAAKDTSVGSADVRHLLVKAETTDANGKDLSDKEVEANFAAAKVEAEKILAEWKKGKATEDSFAALVKEKTDDAGSKETGGLYTGINSESQYVTEFRDWALAAHKPGDTDIVKTTYGYHIMYFVKSEGVKWQTDARDALASEKSTEYHDGIYKDVQEKTEVANEKIVDFFAERNENAITRNLGL
ncbi:MAG: peptidylprolyl isomerase [Clostridia bacterium]|nr:peptidylprolyl isomerase [Clostridia bacterium]